MAENNKAVMVCVHVSKALWTAFDQNKKLYA